MKKIDLLEGTLALPVNLLWNVKFAFQIAGVQLSAPVNQLSIQLVNESQRVRDLVLFSFYSHSRCIFLSRTDICPSGELWINLFRVPSAVKSPVCYYTPLSSFPEQLGVKLPAQSRNHRKVVPCLQRSPITSFRISRHTCAFRFNGVIILQRRAFEGHNRFLFFFVLNRCVDI